MKGEVWAIWGQAQADIKTKIERSTHEVYDTETTQEQSIVLRGLQKPASKYIVRWLQYYRTGTTKVETNGKVIAVPFEFADSSGLESVEVK